MGVFADELAVKSAPGQTFAAQVAEFRAAGLPLNVHSNKYEASRQVKGGPGYLFGFTCYSSNVGAQFIQVFDSPTLPADGAVPECFFDWATVVAKGVQWLPLGRSFQRGIYLCNSSTGPTKTIGSADCFFDAQYV